MAYFPSKALLNIDESPNKPGWLKTWLWVSAAQSFAVLALRLSRTADELYAHVGEQIRRGLICDFQSLIDSHDVQAKRLSHALLREAQAMFVLWDRVRKGTISRRGFKSQRKLIRGVVESVLLRGVFSGNGRSTGMGNAIWRDRENFWTFSEVAGFEPTSNQAERTLCHAVIWRKLSFGTQSERRFVETMPTLIEPAASRRKPSAKLLKRSSRSLKLSFLPDLVFQRPT